MPPFERVNKFKKVLKRKFRNQELPVLNLTNEGGNITIMCYNWRGCVRICFVNKPGIIFYEFCNLLVSQIY